MINNILYIFNSKSINFSTLSLARVRNPAVLFYHSLSQDRASPYRGVHQPRASAFFSCHSWFTWCVHSRTNRVHFPWLAREHAWPAENAQPTNSLRRGGTRVGPGFGLVYIWRRGQGHGMDWKLEKYFVLKL